MATPAKQRLLLLFPLLAVLLLAVSGCVRYEPNPVVEEEVLARYAQRTLAAPGLTSLAARLAKASGDDAVRYDPADGLTLAEAEVAMLFLSPSLTAERARVGIADAVASTAGRLDDPVVSLEATRLLENASSASNPWDSRVALGFVVPVSGRLGVAKDLAEAEAQEALARYLLVQREHLEELRRLWLEYSEAAAAQALIESYLTDVRDLTDLSDRLAEHGTIPRGEARLLRIELLKREAQQRSVATRRDTLRRRLFQVIGVSASAEVNLVPSLEAPAVAEVSQELLIEQHPELAERRLNLEAAEQAFRLEVRRQYPDLSLGPIGAEEDGFWRLGFGLSLPLPIWNKNTQGLAKAEAARDAARAEYEAALFAVLAEVDLLRFQVVVSEERLRFLREELMPVVAEQIEETRGLAELGSVDVLLLREALSMNFETGAGLLAAQRENAQLRWTIASHLTTPPPAISTNDEKASE